MQKSIEAYVSSYGKLVFSICYGLTKDYFDAQDLAQETFIAAYRSLERFNGEREKAWLVRIAVNKCRDYLKSAARRSAPQSELLAQLPSAAPGPDEVFEERAAQARLRALCERLKEPYRTTAVRHFVDGQSAPEIAERIGHNPKSVHTRIRRARGMLRELWEEE